MASVSRYRAHMSEWGNPADRPGYDAAGEEAFAASLDREDRLPERAPSPPRHGAQTPRPSMLVPVLLGSATVGVLCLILYLAT